MLTKEDRSIHTHHFLKLISAIHGPTARCHLSGQKWIQRVLFKNPRHDMASGLYGSRRTRTRRNRCRARGLRPCRTRLCGSPAGGLDGSCSTRLGAVIVTGLQSEFGVIEPALGSGKRSRRVAGSPRLFGGQNRLAGIAHRLYGRPGASGEQ